MRDLWLKFRLTPEILPSPHAAGQLQRERQRATTTILAQRHFAPGLILSDSNASRAARHPDADAARSGTSNLFWLRAIAGET